MQITAIDTVRIAEFPSLVFVRVHTDDGLVGLGETFFHAEAVEAHVHSSVAPFLLGADPRQIERHATALRSYTGSSSSGAEVRSASAIDIALWDIAGRRAAGRCTRLLGGASRDAIRTYNTCAGYRYIRAGNEQVIGDWGLPDGSPAEGPYEDLDAFLHRADELAAICWRRASAR